MQDMPVHARSRPLLILALLALVVGVWGWWSAPPPMPLAPSSPPQPADQMIPGTVAQLTGPAFAFSPGWQVSEMGADPSEPADPWREPAGVLTFSYTGQALWLLLAPGDYWGYLFVTVDGDPANRLAVIPGNRNGEGKAAGYRTLYAPERQTPTGPTPQWVQIHRAADPTQPHQVRVEVWRSWGQTPLRAVAVDAHPSPALARPPFVALALLGVGLLLVGSWPRRLPRPAFLARILCWLTQPVATLSRRSAIAGLALILLTAAVITRVWWLGPLGLALLGYAALRQPALWAAALTFALPFYFSQTLPILPGRATNLIDLGVLGGVAVAVGHWLFATPPTNSPPRGGGLVTGQAVADLSPQAKKQRGGYLRPFLAFPAWGWVAMLAAWALVAASGAEYGTVALREWRTIFLAALLFALLLTSCRGDRTAPWLLLGGWLAGALIMAGIGLGQFLTNASLIEAEGVRRVASLYGSPNNLALYLERSLMPCLALLLLLPNGAWRILAGLVAGVLGAVLLLTFSKGALILGVPAGLLTLWWGGRVYLRRQGASTRALGWLVAAALAAALLLLPFLGTERFQRLVDLNSGTGFTRLQLWRSAWQMALDHPLLGVGPDNFLYAYRSQYLLPAAWQEPNLNHPHTWLLDWWTRLGLPGMALGLAWWGVGIAALIHRLRRVPPTQPALAALWLGLLAAAAAALAHGLIDLSYAVPDLMLIWVLITLLPDLVPEPDTPAARQSKPAEALAPAG